MATLYFLDDRVILVWESLWVQLEIFIAIIDQHFLLTFFHLLYGIHGCLPPIARPTLVEFRLLYLVGRFGVIVDGVYHQLIPVLLEDSIMMVLGSQTLLFSLSRSIYSTLFTCLMRFQHSSLSWVIPEGCCLQEDIAGIGLIGLAAPVIVESTSFFISQAALRRSYDRSLLFVSFELVKLADLLVHEQVIVVHELFTIVSGTRLPHAFLSHVYH